MTVYASALRRSPFVDEVAPTALTEHERIGKDDRQLVDDTLAIPNRWICSLDVMTTDPVHPLRRGSGVFIAPRLVLTAAHCIWPFKRRPYTTSVHVVPARNGRQDPLGRVRAVAYARIPGAYDLDLAVLLVERGFEARRHAALHNQPLGYWNNIGSLADGANLNLPATVRGYPGDRCGTQPFDPGDPDATCPKGLQASTLWTGDGVISNVQGWKMLHTADTYKGDSGAPVWIEVDGQRRLVGIHVDAEVPGAYNKAVHLNPNIVDVLRAWRKYYGVAP